MKAYIVWLTSQDSQSIAGVFGTADEAVKWAECLADRFNADPRGMWNPLDFYAGIGGTLSVVEWDGAHCGSDLRCWTVFDDTDDFREKYERSSAELVGKWYWKETPVPQMDRTHAESRRWLDEAYIECFLIDPGTGGEA